MATDDKQAQGAASATCCFKELSNVKVDTSFRNISVKSVTQHGASLQPADLILRDDWDYIPDVDDNIINTVRDSCIPCIPDKSKDPTRTSYTMIERDTTLIIQEREPHTLHSHGHRVHNNRPPTLGQSQVDCTQPPTLGQPQVDCDSLSSGSGGLYPHLEDKEFEDLVSQMGLGGWHDWEFEDEQTQLRRGLWRELLGLDEDWNEINMQREVHDGPPSEPLYPQGEIVQTECYVCFESAMLRRRLCCGFPVCDSCLESYLIMQVSHANVKIECLNPKCNSFIHRSEISARLPSKMKMKFYKFLIDANVDPTVKTCPRCSSGLQVEKATLKKRAVLKNGLPVTCQRCTLEWCFNCHAPFHKGLTCKQYRKGDALLKDWAREFHYGQLNAQKCPKCKIFIQRSLGCDHMICSRCDTSFCYRCGENYRSFKCLGNHFSRYSPFGCRYNFMPESPHLRRLIRGAILGAKLMGMLALSGFGVAAGAVLLGVGIFALPAWGGYKLHKRRKYRRRLRAHYKYAKEKYTQRSLQLKKPEESETLAANGDGAVLDSSNSVTGDNDDSSEDNHVTFSVGLKLPNKQCVEVVVHGNFNCTNASSYTEEGGREDSKRQATTNTTIIVTDVHEVKNENGYATVVANISAKVREQEITTCVSDDDDVANNLPTPGIVSSVLADSGTVPIADVEEGMFGSCIACSDAVAYQAAGLPLTTPDCSSPQEAKTNTSLPSTVEPRPHPNKNPVSRLENQTLLRKSAVEKTDIGDSMLGGGVSRMEGVCGATPGMNEARGLSLDKSQGLNDECFLQYTVDQAKLNPTVVSGETLEPVNGVSSETRRDSQVVANGGTSDLDPYVDPILIQAARSPKKNEKMSQDEDKKGEKLKSTKQEEKKFPEKGKPKKKKQLENNTEKLCVELSETKRLEQKDADDASKDTSNSCFGNIFSKKIAVNIQIPCRRNNTPQPETQKPLVRFCMVKSVTGDKGMSEQPKSKTTGDIRNASNFEKPPLLQQGIASSEWIKDKRCDIMSPGGTMDKTVVESFLPQGILLQDCLILDAPGLSFSKIAGDGGDTLSLASTVSLGDRPSEKGEIHLALEELEESERKDWSHLSVADDMKGLNLPCGIVTYL